MLVRRASQTLGVLLLAGGMATPAFAQDVDSVYNPLAKMEGAEKVSVALRHAMVQSKSKSLVLGQAMPDLYSKDAKGRAVIEVVADGLDDAVLTAIKATGAEVLAASARFRRATVAVSSPATIAELAAIDAVRMVFPADRAMTNAGKVEGQGDVAHRADLAAAKYGVDGEETVVGILSDSFGSLLEEGHVFTDLPSGPIPGEGDPWTPYVLILKDLEGSDEGRAMGELVHDIAPNAAIAFYTAFVSQTDFAVGISELSKISDVIVDDVSYFAEPMFMPGIVEQAAENAVARGIPFFSSAGNQSNFGFMFDFVDSSGADDTATPPSGADLHRWHTGTPFLPVELEPGAGFRAFLEWNQPWGSLVPNGAEIDLNFYITRAPTVASIRDSLFDTDVQQVMFSINGQGKTGYPIGDPAESVAYTNTTGQKETVYLAIDHLHGMQDGIPQIDGAPLKCFVKFFLNTATIDEVKVAGIDPQDPATGGPSIFGHHIGEGVMAVAAVNWFDTPPFDMTYGPTDEIDPESFSSVGGTIPRYFDRNGVPQVRNRFVPDISAVDGNNTTFFGSGDFDLDGHPNFFGTSAAAPNAAAIAALLLNLNRNLLPAQISAAMVETAIDVKGHRAAPGTDTVSGAGLVDALAAADFVADNFGIGQGCASPQDHLFTFNTDEEGWTFGSTAPFVAPGHSFAGPDVITLTATDSVNTVGWLISPEFIVMPFTADCGAGGGPIPINGLRGRQSLYRTTMRLASDAPSSSVVPSFRIRTSTSNFERSDVLRITSHGNGGLSPSSGNTKVYSQYHQLPASQAKFRVYLDMLSTDPTDLAGTTLMMDEVIVEAFPYGTLSLIDSKLETLKFFENSDHGWTRRDAPPLGMVQSGVNEGLELGPATTPGSTAFSYFGSPESSPMVSLENNRLYACTFRVRCDAPASQKTAVPTFRARINDSSLKLSAYIDINSVSEGANTPIAGQSVDYTLYFEAPDELAGNAINFSFDYLYVPGMGKDPNLKVVLESLRVESFIPPLGQ